MIESKKLQMAIAAVLLVFVLFLAKAVVTGCNHMTLCDAIYEYHMDCIRDGKEYQVEYDDKEDFFATLWRLWDWSDKRILPEEKYRIVKPYLGR